MENSELTLEEILNDPLLCDMVEQDDKALAEAGWTYEDIKGVADLAISIANKGKARSK